MERTFGAPLMHSWRAAFCLVLVLAVALLARGEPALASGSNAIVSPDTAGDVGTNPALTLDADGNPVVSYYDSTNGDLKVLHCGNPDCSTGNTIAAPDSVGENGVLSSIRVDVDNNPVVSYWDFPNRDLKLLHCGDPSCTMNNSIVIADGGNAGAYSSMALDSDGNPTVSYLSDGPTAGMAVLHCGDANCSSNNSIVIADPGSGVGYATSLVIDGGGKPVVSYVRFATGVAELRLLRCGNPDCSSNNNITVLTGLAFGTSLALDTTDNPVIAYAWSGLYLLQCGNPTCTAGNAVTTLDPSPSGAIADVSLALDSMGRPVVAYADSTNGDLKLAHCGDPDCASNTVLRPDVADDVGYGSPLRLDSFGNPVIAYYDQTNGDLKLINCGSPRCDTDDDGCADAQEQQSVPGSELSGGRRDAKDSNDYFNPTHDGQNRVDDVLAVVDQYFIDSGNPGYNPDTDRTLVGPLTWNLGPPNGLQRVDDILNAVHQYFHDCA